MTIANDIIKRDPEQINSERLLQIKNLLDLAVDGVLKLDDYEYYIAVTMVHFGVGAGLDLGIDRNDLESWLPLPPATFKLEDIEDSEFEGIFAWVCELVEAIDDDWYAGADFEINGETSSVPVDNYNKHYVELMEWVAEGNTIAPAD